MTSSVQAIPEGYRTITPYLTIKNAAKAIAFYKKAFDAEEGMRVEMPDGKVGHCELTIGDSKLMLCDEFPGMDMKSPQSVGGTPIAIHLYVEDVDTVFDQAVAAGGKVKSAVKDQFYGDRSGCIQDPAGHLWYVATHIEDVSKEEVERRAAECMTQEQKKSA